MTATFNWILRWRYLVILVSLLAIVLAASGGRFLVFKSDYRVFFGEDNPQLQAFDRMQKTFNKSDNVLLILAPKNGDVFTPENLAAIEYLTKQAWQLPYSIRVDSITNFQHTRAEEDDLIVDDLVIDAQSLESDQIASARAVALKEPLLVNRLISGSGHVAAVNVTIQLPGVDPVAEVPEVALAARALKAKLQQAYPQMQVHLSGMVMMNTSFAESSLQDSQTLVPLMFLAVILLIGALLRTISGTFATLIIIVASIAAAMGLAGWAGLYLTGPSASAPTIILTLAVADCVHILSTLYHEMRQGVEKRQALIDSLKINTRPVILTSVTTAIGFLSMNFSDSPPFHDLGNIVAVGVMLACLFSLTLFPAMLVALPLKVRPRKENRVDVMDRVADFVLGNRRILFWGSATLVLGAAALLPRNELNDNFVEYFDHSVPFRQAADFSEANLTGMSNMEFELSAGEPSGINDPAFLQEADAFVAWLRAQPETRHVDSLTDTMKRLNQNMHGDDPSWYRLPEERELAAQYLLLYEMSLPYGLDLNNQINVEKSAIRVIATYRTLTTNEMLALETKADAWLKEHAPHIQGSISSSALMFAHIGARNIQSMLLGTSVALVLISALLGVALRSLRYGLISLIPNLTPAIVGFGLWGVTVGEVGLGLSVVTGMTLGIVVDDTVHFLSKYLHARQERQADAGAAIRYAFHSVGRALWITTLVLALGFMVLAQSSFKINSDMGLLTAATIVIALVIDFLLLPPLLYALDRKPGETTTGQAANVKDRTQLKSLLKETA